MSYVALLRGINLGKLNKVDMKSLRSVFEEMGFQNVQTYIQTGNVLVNNIATDEQQVELKLKEVYGFDIPVTIRSKDELENVQQQALFYFIENVMIFSIGELSNIHLNPYIINDLGGNFNFVYSALLPSSNK
jgi:uncharacterized protein (DUF1697 family)